MRVFKLAIALLVVGGMGMPAFAGGFKKKCPEKACCPIPETKKDSDYCFEIECKEICIPRVTFPWSKCKVPQCGKVRVVNVLKKKSYDVERCGYKWEIQPLLNTCVETCAPACAPSCETAPVVIEQAPHAVVIPKASK